MRIFDKTVYIQRLLYAVEKPGEIIINNDESLLWNYRHVLKEAEESLDNAIDCLHTALEYKGVIPQLKEI